MTTTLDRVTEVLADVTRALGRVNSNVDAARTLLNALGWELPNGVADIGLTQLDVSEVGERVDDLVALRGDDNAGDAEILAAAGELAAALARAIDGLRAFGGSVQATPSYLQATDIGAQFFPRLADFLVVQTAAATAPASLNVGVLVGVFEFRAMPADAAIFQPQHVRHIVHWNRLVTLLTEPWTLMHDVYGWGTPSFHGDSLIANLARVLEYFGADVTTRPLPRAAEEKVTGAPAPDADTSPGLQLIASFFHDLAVEGSDVGLSLFELRPTAPGAADAGLGISPYAFGTGSAAIPLSDTLSLSLAASAALESGVGLVLRPGQSPALRVGLLENPAAAGPDVSLELALRRGAGAGERLTLFSAPAVTMDAGGVTLGLAVAAGASLDPAIIAKVEGGRVSLAADRSDGLLASILPEKGVSADVDLDLRWSRSQGVHLRGGAGLRTSLALHRRIGPARIETIDLAIIAANQALAAEATVAANVAIGPFKISVEGLGAEVALRFRDGNLGLADVSVGLVPPRGLGVSIDGGGFSGGGFLRRDPAGGEYAGALELEFLEVIQVKAVGVLNSRTPEGGQGYSLVVVISAEFTPIQLSFGFTLNGVGGLLGVNRTTLYDQLRLGLADATLDSILFPKDVIANAPRIIADLKRVFPPQSGRFLIGPMAKLGWGTPPLVTIDLGLVLEIPRPGFAILGVLRVTMPAEDVPLLDMRVNFLGVIDFDKNELSFDASLYDSRLLAFTLTGDMAVRLYWGDNANFLLTAGGFHPSYTPPPLALPALDRLAISMLLGNPRLSAEAYLAITSNTVQFGARVELYYGVKVFNVYGFIGLDALINFAPFHFIAQVNGAVAVRSGKSTLFSIRLELTLEGPSPWHARGRGSFEIGFVFTVTVSASFDVTFGDERDSSLAPIRVAPLIEGALAADGAWRVVARGGPRQHVALRELPPDAGLVVSPYGALAAAQNVAPLNIALSRMGPARIDGPNSFSIVNVMLGQGPAAAPVDTRATSESFAAAQFFDMSDGEKLSRRSFEPFDAGVEITGQEPRADFQRHADVVYEVVYVRKPRRNIFMRLRDSMLDLLVAMSSAGRSRLSAEARTPTQLGTPQVTLPSDSFVIAGIDDLQRHRTDLVFANETAATLALADLVRADGRLAGKLQVVNSYEVAA